MPRHFAPGALRRLRALRATLQTPRVCPAPRPYEFDPLLLLLHGGGPDNKKAPIAGSSKFKLAEEEGFEPS